LDKLIGHLPEGRLVEATTFNTLNMSAFVTDELFSYSSRGEMTDVYEATPHSGVYYHTTAGYWPTGALQSVSGIPSVPTIYYGANGTGLDGEGRYKQVTAFLAQTLFQVSATRRAAQQIPWAH
jgi:hypothetical protein